MSDFRYEAHELSHSRLPIIFHDYTITGKDVKTANWHDNIELLHCLEGTGQVLCDGRLYPFGPGITVAVNSHMIHRVIALEPLHYQVLIVDTDFLTENGIPVPELGFETVIHSEIVACCFGEAAEEICAPGDFSAAAVRGSVLRLMVCLARNHTFGAPPRRDIPEGIKAAIDCIRTNYRQKLTLENVASVAGLSKYYFSRLFKASTGMTVVDFINLIRCRNAQKLLRNHYSVSQAAFLCGFENLSYFSRTYRNIMGCLPSEVAAENEKTAPF